MNLREYLKLNEITQSKFAALLGCTSNYINMICNGKIPGRLLAKEIERMTYSKVSYEELMRGKQK